VFLLIESSSFLPSREIKNILHSGFLEPMMLFPVCPSKTLQLLLPPWPPQTREGALGGERGVFLMGSLPLQPHF